MDMEFTPRRSSTLGGQPILVTFSDDSCGEDGNKASGSDGNRWLAFRDGASGAEFPPIFVIFAGSDRTHEVPAKRINASTVKAVIPAHDEAEEVVISVGYKSMGDDSDAKSFHCIGSGSETFSYYFNPTHTVAEFLFNSVSMLDRLDPFSSINLSGLQLSIDAQEEFDQKLTESFVSLLATRQSDWSLLGPEEDDESQRETLLHFAARLGLYHFAEKLMSLPGAKSVLEIQNQRGELPLDVAGCHGNKKVVDIFNSALDRSKESRSNWAYKAMRKSTTSSKYRNSLRSSEGDNSDLPSPECGNGVASEGVFLAGHQPQGDVLLRGNRPSSAGKSHDVSRDSVFTVDDGSVVLNLKPRTKHESIRLDGGMPWREMGEGDRMARQSRSADPQLDESVSSLEDTMMKLRRISRDFEALREKNKQIIKSSELSSMAPLSASCPSLLDEQGNASPPVSPPIGVLNGGSGGSFPNLHAVINEERKKKKRKLPVDILVSVGSVPSDSEEEEDSIGSVSSTRSAGSSVNDSQIEREVGKVMDCLLERVAHTVDEDVQDVVSSLMEYILREITSPSQTKRNSSANYIFRFSQSSFHEPDDGGILFSTDSPKLEDAMSPTTPPLPDLYKNRSSSAPEGHIFASLESGRSFATRHSRARSVGEAVKLEGLAEADEDCGRSSEDLMSPRRHSLGSSSGGGVAEVSSVTLDFDDDDGEASSGKKKGHRVSVTFQEPAVSQEDEVNVARGLGGSTVRQSMPPQFFYDKNEKSVEREFLNNLGHGEEEPEEDETVRVVTERKKLSASTLDVKPGPMALPAMRRISEEEGFGLCKSNSTPEVSIREQRAPSPETFTRERHLAFRDIRRSETMRTGPNSDGESGMNPHIAGAPVAVESGPADAGVLLRKNGSSNVPTKRRFTSFLSKRKDKDREKPAKSNLQRKGSKMALEVDKKNKKHKNSNEEEAGLLRTSVEGQGSGLVRGMTYSGSPQQKDKGKQKPIQGHKSSTSIAARLMEASTFANSKGVSKSQGSLDTLVASLSDEVGYGEKYEFLLDDSELALVVDTENWQNDVDKKLLKKLGRKEVARQELIHELMLTEKRYLQSVKVLRLMFGRGMIKEIGLSVESVDEIMPRVNVIEEISSSFCKRLKNCQEEAEKEAKGSKDVVIHHIGALLVDQFCGERGERMEDAYSYFCSRYLDSAEKYKEHLRSNKQFKLFVEKTKLDARCRRLDVPEHLMLISQRLSKYNSLLSSLVKQTKDKVESKYVQEAYDGVKRVSHNVDEAIEDRKRELRLSAIQSHLEIRVNSRAMKNTTKRLKNFDLQYNGSKLVYEGGVVWRGSGGKELDVIVVLTSRLLVFLVEKDNEKYNIATLQDIRLPIIQLKRLMSRSVATDSKALYLITTGRSPEMYTIVLKSKKERERFNAILQPTIEKSKDFGDEVDGIDSSESDDDHKATADDSKSLASVASLASPPAMCENTAGSDEEGKSSFFITDERRHMLQDLQSQLRARDLEMESIVKAKLKIRYEMRAVLADSGYIAGPPADATQESLLSSIKQTNRMLESQLNLVISDAPMSPYTVVSGPTRFSFGEQKSPSSNVQELRSRTVSAEPDIHSKANSGVVASCSTSKLELPRLVRERWRPASHGSGDKTPEKYRKKSAPQNLVGGKAASANTLHSGDSSDQSQSEADTKPDDILAVLSLLNQAVETVLTKCNEQQTEIERLHALLFTTKGPDADFKRGYPFDTSSSELGVVSSHSDPSFSFAIRRTPSAASTKSESPFGSPRPSPRSMSPGSDVLQIRKKKSKKMMNAENA
eukprot:m.81743 g.81743  ORF g.81743 m.81743 type:complete len:1794 (+) comp36247_c0_seq4:312-5693(+)